MRSFVTAVIRACAVLILFSSIELLFEVRRPIELARDGSETDTFTYDAAFPLLLAGLMWIYAANMAKWTAAKKQRVPETAFRLYLVSVSSMGVTEAFQITLAYLTEKQYPAFTRPSPFMRGDQADFVLVAYFLVPVLIPFLFLCVVRGGQYWKSLPE